MFSKQLVKMLFHNSYINVSFLIISFVLPSYSYFEYPDPQLFGHFCLVLTSPDNHGLIKHDTCKIPSLINMHKSILLAGLGVNDFENNTYMAQKTSYSPQELLWGIKNDNNDSNNITVTCIYIILFFIYKCMTNCLVLKHLLLKNIFIHCTPLL